MRLSSLLVGLSLSVMVCACGARADIDGLGGAGEGGAGGMSGGTGASTGTGTGPGTGTGTSTGTGTGTSTGTGTGTSTGTGTTTGTGTSTGTTTGTGTTTSTGTGMMVCPGFGDPCTDCLSVECPERYCNCFDNPDCFALFQCASPCNGDQNCVQDCYTQFEGGISDASLLTDCAATTCPAACPGNQGSQLDPCNTCILQSCEDQTNACLAQPSCLQLYGCLTGCPSLDLMCQDACYNAYPDGIATLQAMLSCASNDCGGVCN